jgi:hypothetical protein
MIKSGIFLCDTSFIMIESIKPIDIKKYSKVSGINKVKTAI